MARPDSDAAGRASPGASLPCPSGSDSCEHLDIVPEDGRGAVEPHRGSAGAGTAPAHQQQSIARRGRPPGALGCKGRQNRRTISSVGNPLPVLAVFVDVTWSWAARMLRTAVAAVVDEVVARLHHGSRGRLQRTQSLHRSLQQMWLAPLQQRAFVGLRCLGNALPSAFLKELELLHERCHAVDEKNQTDTAVQCSYTSSASRSLPPEESVGSEGKASHSAQVFGRCLLVNEADIAPDLLASWQPLMGVDGSVAAPPVELLAAYAAGEAATHSKGPRTTTRGSNLRLAEPSCVVGFCVRSLLDLYIQSIRSLQPSLLPKGSVALVAAVNIPMMFRVLEGHGLVVHPLDLDPQTLMPTEDSLRNAVKLWGTSIKALLYPHLFGGLNDLQLLVDFCAKHKIILIEDCAEAFSGDLYRGHPKADISLFSFGMIKTCTAGGGAIATVQSPFVAARMNSLQALYPYSSYTTFFKKLCIILGACFVQNKYSMKTLLGICQFGGWDIGTFLQSFVRGFPMGYDIFDLLRVQPNVALLSVLLRRLESWNVNMFLNQQTYTLAFTRTVRQMGLEVPGYAAALKTFWLFPVIVPEPISVQEFAAALRESGLYAANDSTTLVCHKAIMKSGDRVIVPSQALEMMSRIIYLPVNKDSTQEHLKEVEVRLADCLCALSESGDCLGASKDAHKAS